MRALILNGALAGDDGMTSVEEALGLALAARGWAVERVHLRDLTIAYCKGCFDCWVKTPGMCQTHDGARGVTRAIVRSDLLVLLTPVTFGGYSSELKKALDRSVGLVMPFFTRIHGEVHHKARYARYPALLGIGITAAPDEREEHIFETLVGRNAINFHAPAHGVAFVRRGQPPEQMRATVARAVAQMTAAKRGVA